jgi:hypothetical protein
MVPSDRLVLPCSARSVKAPEEQLRDAYGITARVGAGPFDDAPEGFRFHSSLSGFRDLEFHQSAPADGGHDIPVDDREGGRLDQGDRAGP